MRRQQHPPRPWRAIEEESRGIEAAALLAALERNGWSLLATARELEVAGSSTVQGLIRRLGASETYAQHSLGRGRRRRVVAP
jgi:lambda repressor-like predicted transcriptional regulator